MLIGFLNMAVFYDVFDFRCKGKLDTNSDGHHPVHHIVNADHRLKRNNKKYFAYVDAETIS